MNVNHEINEQPVRERVSSSMPTHSNVRGKQWERLSDIESDWSIVEHRRKLQRFYIIFGVKDSTSWVEFKTACGDTELNRLVSSACIRTLENHMKINIKDNFARFLRAGATGATEVAMAAPIKRRNVTTYIRTVCTIPWLGCLVKCRSQRCVLALYSTLMKGGVLFWTRPCL